MLTEQEIQKLQGTRLSDKAPWETYSDELNGPEMSPELALEVEEYAKKHWQDGKVSTETQEILAEQKELSDQVAKEYQWLPQADYEDEEPRIGRVLNFAEFITILRKHGVNCHYRQHLHHDKAVLYINRHSYGDNFEIAAFVQINGPMPEYELVRFDAHGVVLNTKRRGWRTVLLQAILKGLLTEELVLKAFGPATGPASWRFNSLLYELRNKKIEVTNNGGE